jgi:hypothetical protein
MATGDKNKEGAIKEEDEDIPDLVENFEDVSKKVE